MASTRSRRSMQPAEVGQDEVDAVHGRLGEHEAGVDDDDAPVLFEGQAVAPDLAESAEEGDPNVVLSHAAASSAATTWAAARVECRVARCVRQSGTGRSSMPSARSAALARHRVGVGLGALEGAAGREALVERARAVAQSPLRRGATMAANSRAGPVRGDRHDAHGADRHEGQQQRVVAAVEVEALAEHGLGVGGRRAGRPRRPSSPRRWRGARPGRWSSTRRSCARCATGCRRASPASACASAIAPRCPAMPAWLGRA